MKNIIVSTIWNLSSSLGKKSRIYSSKIRRINPARTAVKQFSSSSSIDMLLSYINHINSGDKNDMMIEKNMKHTIKYNIPESALKNNFTKNIASFITK